MYKNFQEIKADENTGKLAYNRDGVINSADFNECRSFFWQYGHYDVTVERVDDAGNLVISWKERDDYSLYKYAQEWCEQVAEHVAYFCKDNNIIIIDDMDADGLKNAIDAAGRSFYELRNECWLDLCYTYEVMRILSDNLGDIDIDSITGGMGGDFIDRARYAIMDAIYERVDDSEILDAIRKNQKAN